jgi:hypothetical protein
MTERTESVQAEQVPEAVDTTVDTTPVPPPELAKLLAKFRKLCVSAAEVTLDEGRVARQYVAAWCGQGEAYKRAAGIQNLVSELQQHSPDVVRSQRIESLIRHTAAYDVLREATGVKTVKGSKSTLPSVRVIVAFSQLVERDESSRAELWVLSPATAERVMELWTTVLNGGEPGTVALEKVTMLLATGLFPRNHPCIPHSSTLFYSHAFLINSRFRKGSLHGQVNVHQAGT